MNLEQQVIEQRRQLNAAINDRDFEKARSILHEEFSARICDGVSVSREAMFEQVQQMLKSFSDFKSFVEVEQTDINGDQAELLVNRIEAARMRNPQALWGLFAAAAAIFALAIFHFVQGYRVDVPIVIAETMSVEQDAAGEVGPVVSAAESEAAIRATRSHYINATIYTTGALFLVGLALFLGRRTFWQTQRARETWRRVDNCWLLVEEAPVA